MPSKTNKDKKNPRPVKKITSKTPIQFEYFKMTPIGPYEGEFVSLEELRKQVIKQMTDMNKEDIEKMADIIVYLIRKIREHPNTR